MAPPSNFVADVKEHVGEALRVIATYREDEVEFHYLRDDVADEYTSEKIDKIREYILLEGIQQPHIESLFNDRELRGQMFAFGDAFTFHFNIDDTSGRLVSADVCGLESLETFIADCAAFSRAENWMDT